MELVRNTEQQIQYTFDEFWLRYPRKVGKFAARKAFDKLLPVERAEAIAKLPGYIQYWVMNGTQPQYIPHASTWLNQHMFEDELTCELPKMETCHWPKCTHSGINQRGAGKYCDQHFDTLKRGGTPPR